jgi:hypothetical protein
MIEMRFRAAGLILRRVPAQSTHVQIRGERKK